MKKKTGHGSRQPGSPGYRTRSASPGGHPQGSAPENLNYRTLSLRLNRDGRPASLDEKTRSVEVVGATENRVRVYDWQRGEVIEEILLMSGLKLPDSRQVVLLDSHSRWSTGTVLGSYRDMRVEGGQLLGRAHYSTAPEAESPWTKVREGHLTDYSVGYRVEEAVWVPAGKSAEIDGRRFTGPVSVVTAWSVSELSCCPIGADEMAKARQSGSSPRPDAGQNRNFNPAKREVPVMNEKLRKALEAHGLSPEATDEEAWRYLDELEAGQRAELLDGLFTEPEGASGPAGEPNPNPAPAARANANPQDPEAAIAAERARIAEIRALARRYELGDKLDSLIEGGATVDEARAQALDLVAARAQEEPQPGFSPVRLLADERDKFRSAAEGALLLRAGVETEKPAPGADELTGYTMVELARMALRVAGQSAGGGPLEMVGRALTTSDFPNLLANVANKSLFAGFATAEETWQQVFATGSVSDFKTHTSVRASEVSDLEEVPEEQEYKYGKRTDGKEEYSIATYGKIYAISRQAIINDDLNALSDTPRLHGEAAARKIGDVAWSVITANAAMGDGIALFHANHSNLVSSGAPLSTTQIAKMIELMKRQKDLQGLRRLNIRPRFFVAPVALEGSAEQFFTTTIDPGKDIPGVNNPYSGNYFTRVYEPRLDDDSAAAYYLLGAKGKTVKVFFLAGQQKPYLETRQGWSVDGVEYKVRIDAGAKAMDWKAMVKNPGA